MEKSIEEILYSRYVIAPFKTSLLGKKTSYGIWDNAEDRFICECMSKADADMLFAAILCWEDQREE